MKIINVNKFYYLRGGAERYFFSLAALLQQHGHAVIPFSMQHPNNLSTKWNTYFPSYVEFGRNSFDRSSQIPNSQFNIPNSIRAAARMFWSFEVAKKFDQLVRDTKPDLIHIHNIYHQLSPSLLSVAKRRGIPVVMTVHDYKLIWPDYLLCGYPTSPRDLTKTLSRSRNPSSPPLCKGRDGWGWARWGFSERETRRRGSYWNVVRQRCTHGSYLKSLLTFFEWRFHQWLGVYQKNIDLFLAPSAFVKEKLIAGGYDAQKIQVLPHFVMLTPYKGTLCRNKGSLCILYFGRLSKEKGVDILLDMMQNIGSEVELRIAGEGPEKERLAFRVERLGLRNVTFLGRLDQKELQHAIDRATVIVAPSIVPETFGYTILESFARGKTVVASRIGAFPELVANGKNGFLVSPGNAKHFGEKTSYLLTHPRERKILEQAARATAQHYTAAKQYTALSRWYQDLL